MAGEYPEPPKPERPLTKMQKISLGIALATVAIPCLQMAPTYLPVVDYITGDADDRRVYDGPIAAIAVNQRGWDERGFRKADFSSDSGLALYHYIGHRMVGKRRGNPENKVCEIVLYANPSTTFPYGGDSGFVYKVNEQEILYNPTLMTIYEARSKHGPVPPECALDTIVFASR
jgi:hypothetical protein